MTNIKSGAYNNIKLKNAKKEFLGNRNLHIIICFLAVVWIITAISPYDRADWLLENLLVFVFLAVFIAIYPFFRFSNISYFLIAIMMSLHMIGAHYSYTETPVDALLKAALGFKRDNFDRIVHFGFGLLISYPIYETIARVLKMCRFWACCITVSFILAASAFYELLEMWVAKIVSPELGTLFLGTQGDQWDTQSDMAMAFYGTIVAILVIMITYRKSVKKVKHSRGISL